jgi:hypothetical protein
MTAFIVDLMDTNHVPIGDGPLHNVLNVSVTESLDEAGQIQFSVPATDPRAATYLDQALRFRVRFSDGTEVYGLKSGDTIDAVQDAPTRTITGQGMLGELGRYSCGWWCFYCDPDTQAGMDIGTVVLPDLLGAAGWSAGTLDNDLGDFYGRFDGDSILAALIKITQQTPGKHFRLGDTLRTLDMGAFGVLNTTVRFINVPHLLVAQESNPDIAIITALQVAQDYAPIVNRIIPWGAGEDSGDTYRAKVKLFHLDRNDERWANIHVKAGIRGGTATISSIGTTGTHDDLYYVDTLAGFFEWPIQQLLWCQSPSDLTQPIGYDFVVDQLHSSAPINIEVRDSGNPSGFPPTPPSFPAYLYGNPQLYLQDDTAWSADPHEATVVFNDITLNDLSTGEWAQGASQLYNRAWRYLQTHKEPRRSYTLSAMACPDSVRAGDKIKVEYHGQVTSGGLNYGWIDVDEELYVIRITRTYDASGATQARIEVSNVDDQATNDQTVIYDQAAQVGSINRSAH